jgi:hypothetical protein
MKKILLPALLLAAATALAQTQPDTPTRPVIFRPPYDPPAVEEDNRFLLCENTGGTGLYWIDTTNADLWLLDPETMEWNYLGSPRGADSGRKGTYILLSDRHGGVYVLNTGNGEGWWTDGAVWKNIGEPRRRMKREE